MEQATKPVIHNPVAMFDEKMQADRKARQEQTALTSVDALLKLQSRMNAVERDKIQLEARVAYLEQAISRFVTKKPDAAFSPSI